MTYLKLLFTLVVIMLTLSLVSCDKNTDQGCDIPAKFQDLTGISACGFVLVLNLEDEERRLEPINLDDFDITPKTGLEVCIEFTVRNDLASACQVGEIVELTKLIEINN